MSDDACYLYVEDDPVSREAMRMIVQQVMKVPIVILENSGDFMKGLQDLPDCPKLILLDIHMQPYDGFELLALLRAVPQYSNIPVAAVTASVMNEEIEKLRAAGFNGAIAKPFSMRTLPDLLRRLENHELVWNVTRS